MLLVVGPSEEAAPGVTALRRAGARLVHEPSPSRAMAMLAAAPEAYELVIGACGIDAEGRRALLAAVADTGSGAPVCFLDRGASPGCDPAECLPVCGVEHTPGGGRVMRCALAGRCSVDDAPADARARHVFVYNGPVGDGG